MAALAALGGLNVVLVARRRAKLDALAAELSTQHDVEGQVIAADLSTQAGLDALLTQTAALDVGLLVAAAGFGTSGSFLDGRLETEADMLAVNCHAAMVLSHAFGQRMVQRGRGGIVLMGSLVGFQGVPGSAHYAATKAYIQSLAEGLHHELRPQGVDVLSSAPGPVASGFAERADMQMGATSTPHEVALGTLKALGRQVTVRPGWLSKALGWSLSTAPRWLRVRMMQQIMGGMTQHQLTQQDDTAIEGASQSS